MSRIYIFSVLIWPIFELEMQSPMVPSSIRKGSEDGSGVSDRQGPKSKDK